jgi:tyrocidine synthetase-3
VINTNLIPLTPAQSRVSFQIGPALHFLPGMLVETPIDGLANVNHSCDPNAYVAFDIRNGQLILRATKSIEPGEELTCDYDASEAVIAHPFSCSCGTKRCRKFISGYATT